MKLIIYTLQGCKICTVRQKFHNDLAEILKDMGIETLGILYGMINGKRYEPFSQHDHLCRKPDNMANYMAPVYILESDDAVVKLEDFGQYKNTEAYADYIQSVIDKIDK